MGLENDFTRRFLLLAGDMVDCGVELSQLRNQLLDHKDELPKYLHDEIAELTKTLARVKREYAEMFNTLSDLTKGKTNEIPHSHSNPYDPCSADTGEL